MEDLYVSVENLEGIPFDLWRYKQTTEQVRDGIHIGKGKAIWEL